MVRRTYILALTNRREIADEHMDGAIMEAKYWYAIAFVTNFIFFVFFDVKLILNGFLLSPPCPGLSSLEESSPVPFSAQS
jgi:repressor of nif and glnA expression